MFYSTLYASKHATNDDTMLHKYTMDFVGRKIKNDLVKYAESNSNPESIDGMTLNDFKVGLSRLLVGITGHLQESVVSSTIAAHVISTGTRFHFSHDFRHIMIRQFEQYFAEENIQFKMRWSRDSMSGYIDSDVFNYMYRPQCLENLCLYEFISKFDCAVSHTVS